MEGAAGDSFSRAASSMLTVAASRACVGRVAHYRRGDLVILRRQAHGQLEVALSYAIDRTEACRYLRRQAVKADRVLTHYFAGSFRPPLRQNLQAVLHGVGVEAGRVGVVGFEENVVETDAV
jgi:hypothetical protein